MKTATFLYPEHGDGKLIKRQIVVDSTSGDYITGYENQTWKKFSKHKIINFSWVKPKLNVFQQARVDNLKEMQKCVNEGIIILSNELGFSVSCKELTEMIKGEDNV